jgi:hypothetical protein
MGGSFMNVIPPSKVMFFQAYYSAGKAVTAAENVVVDVGKSPMVMASEALGRPMVGTTKGCPFFSIGLVRSSAFGPSTD